MNGSGSSMLDPRRAEEVAAQLGVSRPFVSKITSLYNSFHESTNVIELTELALAKT